MRCGAGGGGIGASATTSVTSAAIGKKPPRASSCRHGAGSTGGRAHVQLCAHRTTASPITAADDAPIASPPMSRSWATQVRPARDTRKRVVTRPEGSPLRPSTISSTRQDRAPSSSRRRRRLMALPAAATRGSGASRGAHPLRRGTSVVGDDGSPAGPGTRATRRPNRTRAVRQSRPRRQLEVVAAERPAPRRRRGGAASGDSRSTSGGSERSRVRRDPRRRRHGGAPKRSRAMGPMFTRAPAPERPRPGSVTRRATAAAPRGSTRVVNSIGRPSAHAIGVARPSPRGPRRPAAPGRSC